MPTRTIASASARLSSSVFIRAPLPVFTSSTIASAPDASFLLMMEDTISGSESTVDVTSRRAYSVLSAGARCPVCAATTRPISFTWRMKSSTLIATDRPGMDSSLSSVPPVCPSPLPLIFATGAPQAAVSGASTSVVVSPTPPVECLSTLIPGMADRSATSPESRMARVSSVVSRSVIPFRRIAISSAASW